MTLFSMGTVVLCHKWLRKQGKLDVQINVSWLKGEKKHNQDSGADLVPKSNLSQNKHWDTQQITRHSRTRSYAGLSLCLSPSVCCDFEPLELPKSSFWPWNNPGPSASLHGSNGLLVPIPVEQEGLVGIPGCSNLDQNLDPIWIR